MVTVFIEQDIFNDIIIYNDDYPNWRKILTGHAEICLNITEDNLKAEEVPGTEIFEFIHSLGGKKINAVSEYIEDIKVNNALLLDWPRGVFFLNLPKDKADELQKEYGIIVQSNEEINDILLTGSFKRKLLKDETIENGPVSGWKELLKFKFPPSNSIVISDNYLLPTVERVGAQFVKLGKMNLIWLLDAILPNQISVPYHIAIISEDDNKNELWRNTLAGDIKTEISSLRNYEIKVEVIFVKSENFHERILMMNYINSSCEHGFCVFKSRDGKTVHMVNKLQINSYFSSIDNNQGESEYEVASKDLKLIKNECTSLAAHINSGVPVYRGAILGDCNADKSINNRLLNDV